MKKSKSPSTFSLLRGLLLGLAVLALSAGFLASISGRSFVPVFFAVIAGTLFTGTLLLVWLTRWAMRDDGQIGQFGIGTLLMLTGLAALYLGFVRWLTDYVHPMHDMGYAEKFITVCALSTIMMAFSLIPLLSMAESLVWLAARMVRWEPVRRLLFGKIRQDNDSCDH